jgi:hypothetical protein
MDEIVPSVVDPNVPFSGLHMIVDEFLLFPLTAQKRVFVYSFRKSYILLPRVAKNTSWIIPLGAANDREVRFLRFYPQNADHILQ